MGRRKSLPPARLSPNRRVRHRLEYRHVLHCRELTPSINRLLPHANPFLIAAERRPRLFPRRERLKWNHVSEIRPVRAEYDGPVEDRVHAAPVKDLDLRPGETFVQHLRLARGG